MFTLLFLSLVAKKIIPILLVAKIIIQIRNETKKAAFKLPLKSNLRQTRKSP